MKDKIKTKKIFGKEITYYPTISLFCVNIGGVEFKDYSLKRLISKVENSDL